VHSRPPTITTSADLERVRLALATFLELLSDDPRVRAEYAAWLRRAELEDLIKVYKRGLVDKATAESLEALQHISANMFAGREADLIDFDGFTRQVLGLQYPWLARALFGLFGKTVLAAIKGQGPKIRFKATVDVDPPDFDWPVVGRRSRNAGRDIARNVVWFYRSGVKQPPDSIASLAREYLAREYPGTMRRSSDARSVVRNGINQARSLLDLVSGQDADLK
jgi:hypothetical protein